MRDAVIGARRDIGAVVSFLGLVREIYENSEMPLTLEHYPGMTERSLERIRNEAIEKFALDGAAIVHRVGPMLPGEEIVLVIAASRHRQSAFDGANYMMDYLKTKAPFWKKEGEGADAKWVEARESDEVARRRWES